MKNFGAYFQTTGGTNFHKPFLAENASGVGVCGGSSLQKPLLVILKFE